MAIMNSASPTGVSNCTIWPVTEAGIIIAPREELHARPPTAVLDILVAVRRHDGPGLKRGLEEYDAFVPDVRVLGEGRQEPRTRRYRGPRRDSSS